MSWRTRDPRIVQEECLPSRKVVYIEEGVTRFLNVDLDIYSNEPLDSLVAAFGNRVLVAYLGREKRSYSTHLSLARYPRRTSDAILGLTALVERLPRGARRLWNQAKAKIFNVGIQGGLTPQSTEFPVSKAAMDALARVGGSITLTVYAAEVPKRRRTVKGSS